MHTRRFVVSTALFAALALAGCGSSGTKNGATVGFSQGQTAPAFALTDINGQPVSLAEYKGKVVMVNFWATWCGPCRAELPDLVKLHDAYKDKGFVLLGVSADEEGPSLVKAFAEKNGLTYSIPMADQASLANYGVRAFPTTFVIDANGVIQKSWVGAQDYATFEAAVKPLLPAS